MTNKNENKTLGNFLNKYNNYGYGSIYDLCEHAKDLTLEEFLSTCHRGDWILWLFAHINPESLRELTLVKGYCAYTIKHLLTDKRSKNAVDAAMAFGKGKISREELDDVVRIARVAASDANRMLTLSCHIYAYRNYIEADSINAAVHAAHIFTTTNINEINIAADAAAHVAAAAARVAASNRIFTTANSAFIDNQERTADICRKYLPIEIWNQDAIY